MAFLLASIWPEQIDPSKSDCILSGNYCVTSIKCEAGHTLASYTCPGGVAVCCDEQPAPQTCAQQGGDICDLDENCVGIITEALDTSFCCVGGACQVPTPVSECGTNYGECAPSCVSGKIKADYDCPDSGDVCCVQGEEPTSLWWLWLLIILIILVVIGIIFRNKLRPLFRKGPAPLMPGPRPMGSRPGMPPAMIRRPIPRRILPPSQRRAPLIRPAKPAGKSSELTDVLKKLKELGK